MKKSYIILFLFTYFVSAQSNYEINVINNRFQIDESKKLIICKVDISSIPNLNDFTDVDLVLGASKYYFKIKPETIDYQTAYNVFKNNTIYSLYFSVFPLISITTDNEIVDEPKRLANFYYADDESLKKSFVGIEIRGGFSQAFPKKTYDLEFWEDVNGKDSKNIQFGNLRNDDDWVLDALYNEPLRIRSFSAHQLWLDMHEPYYITEEDEAKSGADVMYVDFFLNGDYRGVYMISEQVDRKQLKLKKYKNETIRGELYKAESWITGNVIFNGLPNYVNDSETWGGYEVKLPDPDDTIDWENLYSLKDFVMNSDLQTFRNEIADKVKIENAIDYFIFLNLTSAMDNRGKNIYVAKYTIDEPYFFVPWDLDGVFGIDWRGNNRNITDDVLSNGLFNRLLHISPTDEVLIQISNRWNELRSSILSNSALQNRLVGNYNLLKDNLVFEREQLVWQNYPFNKTSKDYMMNWLDARLQYLDTYFFSRLSTENFNRKANQIKIYPNPTRGEVNIKYASNNNIKYTLYNIEGVLISKGVMNSNTKKISLQSFPSGIYFLKVKNSIKKIIKF